MLLLPKVINLETGIYNWIWPSKICWKRSLDKISIRKITVWVRSERVLFFRPDASGLVLFYQEKRTYKREKIYEKHNYLKVNKLWLIITKTLDTTIKDNEENNGNKN